MNYPLISFCLFSYNQENFIFDAVKSVINQEYPNLEIIISDDCSTDKTFKIIQDIHNELNCKHKLILNRNEKNLGLVKHVNYVLSNLANGIYILLASGDDISYPNRTFLSYSYLIKNDIYSVHFNSKIIDEKGNYLNKNVYSKNNGYEILNLEQYYKFGRNLVGSTKAFKKELFDIFKELNENCTTEDTTITFRSLLLGKAALSYEIVGERRYHNNNLSNKKNDYLFPIRNKYIQYITDLKKAYNNNIVNIAEYNKVKHILLVQYKISYLSKKIFSNFNFFNFLFLIFSIKLSLRYKLTLIKLLIFNK